MNSSPPGKLPPQTRVASQGADDRDGEQHAVADCEAHPGEQVVGKRVADVALDDREREHRHADGHVDVARPAKRPRVEDPQQVEDDRGEEEIGRPVMGLPNQQAGLGLVRELHVER